MLNGEGDGIVRRNPDRAIARGLPPEAVKLAEDRVRALNRAWEELQERAA